MKFERLALSKIQPGLESWTSPRLAFSMQCHTKSAESQYKKPPQQPLKLFNLSESSNICNVYVCICLYLKAIETSLRMTRTTLKGLKTQNLKCVMPEQV